MNTIIYDHYYRKLDHDIAHINEKGIVYNDPVHEAGYSCGHIGDGGRVYSHPTSKAGYCLGHVDESGKIYNHPTSKTGHCVGHVDSNGVIYTHSNSELGYEVGHAEGPYFRQAAAIYLLMFYKGKSESQSSSIPKTDTTPEYTSEQQSQPKTERPVYRSQSSGGGFGILLFFGVAAALSFLDAMRKLIIDNPTWLLLILLIGFMLLSPLRKRKLNDFQVSDEIRAQCLSNAKSSTLLFWILPVALGVYSIIKTQPRHFGEWIFILIPVIMSIVLIVTMKYLKNLEKAENGYTPTSNSKTNTQEHISVSKPTTEKSAQLRKIASTHNTPKSTPKSAPKPTSESKQKSASQSVSAPKVNSALKTEPSKVIITCSECNARMSIPAGRGNIRLKCPKCGNEITEKT